MSTTRFGVDYFPEHWDEERLQTDAEMMVAAGIEVVRVAEFSGSKIQPQTDVWNWDWLIRRWPCSVATAKVIRTLTACPPPC